jgi:hypothetical protein
MLDINLSNLIRQIDDNLSRSILNILKPIEAARTSHDNWVNRLKSNNYTETYYCPSCSPRECKQCKEKETCKYKKGFYLTVKYNNPKEFENALAIPLDNKKSENWDGTILSGYRTIQDIKNNLASLSITDEVQAKRIIIRYFDTEKLSLLQNLSFAIQHSILFIPNKDDLVQMINKLTTEINKMKPRQEDPGPSPPQPHFTRQFTDTEQQKLYAGLTEGAFLPKGTDYSYFCHVFGGTAIPEDKKPFEPLQWQMPVALLAYMIDNLFSDTDGINLWKITVQCFVANGKAPNRNSMKNAVCKYKNDNQEKPRGYAQIDRIITSR